MKTENICECGHEKDGIYGHFWGVGRCMVLVPIMERGTYEQCLCRKFIPQNQARLTSTALGEDCKGSLPLPAENNQSQENSNLPDARKGIFDTTDCVKDEERCKACKFNGKTSLHIYCPHEVSYLIGKERQRLKAEVEKILDEYICYPKEGICVNCYNFIKELKKRLFG